MIIMLTDNSISTENQYELSTYKILIKCIILLTFAFIIFILTAYIFFVRDKLD